MDSISATLKELEAHGYLTRQRLHDKRGLVGDVEYTIHEKPQVSEDTPPKRDFPEQAKPTQKKDDNTFIGNLTYKLQTVTTQSAPYSTQIEALNQDVTKPFTATLQINNINGYTGNYVYNKEEQLNENETVSVLNDTLTFEIDVTPNLSSNRIYKEEAMQNGIIIENITATPRETEIKYFVPKEFNNPAITLETSKGLRLYPLGGYVEFTDNGEWTTMAFDAVPIDIDEVKICFIDKNNDDNILAEFNCLLE